MPFLQENERKEIKEILLEIKEPVKLVYFTQELECQFCRETRQLLEELKELSEKLSLEVYNFQLDQEKVAQYKIDKIPATVVEGEKDYGIRFYGIPSGYEFSSLLESILLVSQKESGLSSASKEKVKTIDQPVHLQVFVTPT
jgi:glutaredoxin-like protein